MDLDNLLSNYHVLLRRMAEEGYSASYIKRIEFEINWIRKHPELRECKSYIELYERRLVGGRTLRPSLDRIYQKRSLFTVLQHFDEDGEFPDHHEKIPLVKKAAYYQLNNYYQSIVNQYKVYAAEKKQSPQGIKKCVSKASCFLLYLQNSGNETLKTVTEAVTLSFFTDSDGKLIRSSSYQRDIKTVLSANIGNLSPEINRVCLQLPTIRKRRKNIQYLTPEEAQKISKALENSNGFLSRRDVAIGVLLYYTGMRAGDVAALLLDEIDWISEQIVHLQGKTGYPVLLPMDVIVGNALYDYITEERPQSDDPHVFLWAKNPPLPIAPNVIWPTTARIYKAAGVRQNSGDRRGSHLFRHHVATKLAENGISQAIISEILGHEAPSSLNHYLSADIEHLRECALSIAPFPVGKGVLQV